MIDEFFAYREPAAIGVSFRRSGKIYYFAPSGLRVRQGEQVVAQTEKGVDIGEVVLIKYELHENERGKGLKPLLRKATAEDLAREQELQLKEREARKVGEQKVVEHKLPMRIIAADYTFDGERLIFFFSAEGRVDFRDLVRDLAETFHTRIELRQVGVRDQAKMIGGLGPCGRPLCCNAFLRNFDPVGIRVAKDQGLSLNPAKISGICDRLMCCLRYEHETYLELARKLPRVGELVQTRKGPGEVRHVNLMHERLQVRYPDDQYEALKASEVWRMDEEIPPVAVSAETEAEEQDIEVTRPIVPDRQPDRGARQRPPRQRPETSRPARPAPARQEAPAAAQPPTAEEGGDAPAQKSRRRRRRSDRKPRPQGEAAPATSARDAAPQRPIQPFRPPPMPPKPATPPAPQGESSQSDQPPGERPPRKRRPRFRSRPKDDSPPAPGS